MAHEFEGNMVNEFDYVPQKSTLRNHIEKHGCYPDEYLMKSTMELAKKRVKEVMDQREEILTAFIAKYGFEPDRITQVEQRMPDMTTRWFVRWITDEEMERRIID